ncbi:GNAT family acetyltransferase [Paenibacillus swuensis]|uniref:GNAT family acetyltransferase n=1 Tax=Paenibacillus swuensis TaxID=1178515 RepID=A0A172TQR7_9BACL|nr:GNAT family N-acetyltransferase [Paenibacillus swuensis]ANE49103.1 GNAT family acetyltransferase [Paenibacillus swuensis]
MRTIRNVKPEDLNQLSSIELQCFPEQKAATREAFQERIRLIPDSFWVAETNGIIEGFVNGPVTEEAYITDDLFTSTKENPPLGGHQTILGLAVPPHLQNQGIAAGLLKHLEQQAFMVKRQSVTLTCKEELTAFYERRGYINKGVSASNHGGIVWYNMTKELHK